MALMLYPDRVRRRAGKNNRERALTELVVLCHDDMFAVVGDEVGVLRGLVLGSPEVESGGDGAGEEKILVPELRRLVLSPPVPVESQSRHGSLCRDEFAALVSWDPASDARSREEPVQSQELVLKSPFNLRSGRG